MKQLSAFAAGLVFGLGLLLSGMSDPGKVLGFLDFTGAWDPSLALVMGGAVLVGLFAFAAAKRRTTAFVTGNFKYSQMCSASGRLLLPDKIFMGFARVL